MVLASFGIRLYRASHGAHGCHRLQNGRVGLGRNGAENR
jgi:hypothetical protein